MYIQAPNILTNKKLFSFRQKETKNNDALSKINDTNSYNISVGYINDIHGQTNNMLRILSGLKGDLKLSGGDNMIGDEGNKKINNSVIQFLNLSGIQATALGNHEFDTSQTDFKNIVSKYNGFVLASNLKQEPIEKQKPEIVKDLKHTSLSEVINNSAIVDVKGEKIGLIGAAPIDLKKRIIHTEYYNDCEVSGLNETIKNIQKEADILKNKGVNKIFLLSHLGYIVDKFIARHTDGIDVIIGGHTHELVHGIEEGDNLQYSESGEPVIITESGKNGKHFGLLNLSFDKNGVITKAQNNIANSNDFQRSLIHQYIFNQNLGTPEDIGKIEYAPESPQSLTEENPHANFMCDAMKYETDSDISLWNNGGPRGFFKKGNIDSRDIKDIAPFHDKVAIADVSEKRLVDMFKKAVETTYRSQGNKPGLLAVSGLTYTVDQKNGKLAEMTFIDKEGKKHIIDINNPSENKKYKVVCDSFMMYKNIDYMALAEKENCTVFDFNKDYLACEYIKHLNKPIVINQTGRIKYI